jgi:transcriptional regulator with XRE-family HTH domain
MKVKTLAELRKEKGVSQRDLVKETGVTSVPMYETGERQPTLGNALKIARFFNRPVESIQFANEAHDTRVKESA